MNLYNPDARLWEMVPGGEEVFTGKQQMAKGLSQKKS
jgi:hypothetical protein